MKTRNEIFLLTVYSVNTKTGEERVVWEKTYFSRDAAEKGIDHHGREEFVYTYGFHRWKLEHFTSQGVVSETDQHNES